MIVHAKSHPLHTCAQGYTAPKAKINENKIEEKKTFIFHEKNETSGHEVCTNINVDAYKENVRIV